jgi:sulfatase modifying factor 1
MKPMRLLIALLAAALPPLAAQEQTYKNSIGVEFVPIQPGTMQVGVYKPSCPDRPGEGARMGGGPAANPGGLPAMAARGPQGAPAQAGGQAARGGAPRRAPQDPRVAWTEADYKKCQELATRDSTTGFPVKITKPYYIGKFEVTQEQWEKVMGSNPSTFQGNMVKDDPGKHPVDSVTWRQAQDFVTKLNQMEKTKAYRLPTEFEWEYAGRAGGPGQATRAAVFEMAVISSPGRGGEAPTAPQTTSAVGTKKPNAWGLYDMLGNVWEWVADPYNGKMFPDPVPPKSGQEHVLKGGGFGAADAANCIYSTHGAGPADGYDVGFRIVKDVK